MTTFIQDQVEQRTKRNEWRRRKALENPLNLELAAVFGLAFFFGVTMMVAMT